MGLARSHSHRARVELELELELRSSASRSHPSLTQISALPLFQLPRYSRLVAWFRTMNWAQRKIYLYNVTFGLYMLDWWERCLFNTLVVVLMWFILYNGSKYALDFSKRYIW